jgi:streptogramin lyase
MRPTRYLLLAALALAVLAGAPAAVAGKPVGIAESFPTNCAVEDVAALPGGGAWFACTKFTFTPHQPTRTQAQVGRITASGQVSEFPSTAPLESAPARAPGVTAADGSFWFPVAKSFYAESTYVKTKVPPTLARVTPSGEMKLFPVSGSVLELAALPDGTLRMKTIEGKNAVVWLVTPTGEMSKTGENPALPLGETATFPKQPVAPTGTLYTGRALGADGNLWFGIQTTHGAIGRITPSGETTEFSECLHYSQPYFGPEELVRGSEGDIWFTSLAERSLPNIVDPPSIGMVTPTGAITQIYAGVHAEPKTISATSEGGVWFASRLNEIERIKPPQGPVNTFHIGTLYENRRGGTGWLKVTVPGPGRLRAKAKAIVTGNSAATEKRIPIHDPVGTASTQVCGSPQVKVKLTGGALHRLRQDGNVSIAIEVTYTPRGGRPYSEEKVFLYHLLHRH